MIWYVAPIIQNGINLKIGAVDLGLLKWGSSLTNSVCN